MKFSFLLPKSSWRDELNGNRQDFRHEIENLSTQVIVHKWLNTLSGRSTVFLTIVISTQGGFHSDHSRISFVPAIRPKPRQPATPFLLTLDVAGVESLAHVANAAASIAVVARVSRAYTLPLHCIRSNAIVNVSRG